MNVLTEFSMPLSMQSYKHFVTGEECQIVAKEAIKRLLEDTMESALIERLEEKGEDDGPERDRRNGYYERNLLTSWGGSPEFECPGGARHLSLMQSCRSTRGHR